MNKNNYHIITYGCQMNKSDSERIATVLEDSGFKPSSLNKADYAFLNLCSVRQSAIDRVWGKINNIKKNNSKTKIVLTGCILPSEKNKFLKKVDYILDIKDLFKWDILINKNKKDYLKANPKINSPFQAFVPIMTGCNNFCSYCAVPYTRGREHSRPTKDIIDEVNKLIVRDYKFIILLGQNVNSYEGGLKFSELLKKIDKITGNYWLSFVTSHPKDMSNELIKCFNTCKHLIPYLHLPIQSGSNKILKAMNRKYTTEDYLKLIKKIKKINPNINLSTDIIVGFPNETKKDFNNTAEIFKKIKFDMAYIARYSPRPDTEASKLKDNISLEEKKNREKSLNNLLKKSSLENNKKILNKNIQVLIENKKDNYYFGKTRNFKNIKIKTRLKIQSAKHKNFIGKFINIKIIKANIWNLEGEIIK
ncbi:MAG: tRNA (N6-isopentenyl adenosine(37)-C2)-methylthiotransferase MiaB [Patescibacteria group bacterium]